MEVVRGVHQIKIPLPDMPLDHVNVYLIEGEKGNMLIDAGWYTPEALSILEEELRKNGFTLNDITQIVVTHLHPDHYGMAGKIREISGAKIALSAIETGMLDSRYINFEILIKEMLRFFRTNGVPKEELPKISESSLPAREFVIPTTPQIKLKDKSKISVDSFQFKAILTPGHSPGHICLYEPKRKLLFSGDHVLPQITPNVGLHPQSGENPLGDFISSLKSLMNLDVSFVFPGHGPVFNGLKQRIEDLLYHHEQRKTNIADILRGEMKTGYAVAEKIPWMTDYGDACNFQDMNFMDKRLAVMETLSHLQLLVVEGKAKKTVKNDINYYSLNLR